MHCGKCHVPYGKYPVHYGTACALWEMSYELWEMSYVFWEMSCTLWGCPVHYGMFGSHLDLNLPDASSEPSQL